MKRFFILVTVLLGLGVVSVATLILGVGFWLSPQDTLQKSDAIIAISGGDTTARTIEAVKLYKAGWAPKIIFSGAALDPNSPSNAKAMQLIAIKAGVPSGDIYLDENSANTLQNADDVAFIVKTHNFTKLILITSPYHQRRASIAFHSTLGPHVTIINHSTVDQAWRRNKWWATNYSYNLTITELKKNLYLIWTGRQSQI